MEESYCNIFHSKSTKVEVLGESGWEFHNLADKYKKEVIAFRRKKQNIITT